MVENKLSIKQLATEEANVSSIKIPVEIGYLQHKQTKTKISVFSEINWFHRMMLRLCFGLIYVKKS